MLVYMGCLVYKRRGRWRIVDDTKEWHGSVVAEFTDSQFRREDVNEYAIIRDWRRDHPAKEY